MNKRSNFVESQWRWTKRFAVFFPFWVLLILGINIWQDAQASEPFDPQNLLYTAGIIAFSIVVLLFNWLIYKSVRSFVRHEERRE